MYKAYPLDEKGLQRSGSERSTTRMTRVERRNEGVSRMQAPGSVTQEIAKDLKAPHLLGEYFRKLEHLPTSDGKPKLNKMVWAYYFTNPDTAFYFRMRWT